MLPSELDNLLPILILSNLFSWRGVARNLREQSATGRRESTDGEGPFASVSALNASLGTSFLASYRSLQPMLEIRMVKINIEPPGPHGEVEETIRTFLSSLRTTALFSAALARSPFSNNSSRS